MNLSPDRVNPFLSLQEIHLRLIRPKTRLQSSLLFLEWLENKCIPLQYLMMNITSHREIKILARMHEIAANSDSICLKSNTSSLFRFTHSAVNFFLNFPISINGSSIFLASQPETPDWSFTPYSPYDWVIFYILKILFAGCLTSNYHAFPLTSLWLKFSWNNFPDFSLYLSWYFKTIGLSNNSTDQCLQWLCITYNLSLVTSPWHGQPSVIHVFPPFILHPF